MSVVKGRFKSSSFIKKEKKSFVLIRPGALGLGPGAWGLGLGPGPNIIKLFLSVTYEFS
jgi:hypothetical protein